MFDEETDVESETWKVEVGSLVGRGMAARELVMDLLCVIWRHDDDNLPFSRAHISSVQANRAWRMRNQEAIENDIFSSASAAASTTSCAATRATLPHANRSLLNTMLPPIAT